jgi:cell fate regulator YaaT (PSP1 superfamily)
MPEVINVRFRNRGKVYFFDPAGLAPSQGEQVVVETAKGLEIGECVQTVHEVDESGIVAPLRPVIRIATREDLKIAEENREKEKAAFAICQEKINGHGLDMKLVDVEYSFEGGKILFFFTSDGRVDFRELVKDLASVFRTRIELRQIGVRDGAKMLGGLGICGRGLCCNTFLDDFQPVSIKMAKTQALSLNPAKISGVCGRLMCCLKYEQEAYEQLQKTVPKVDAEVDTPQGKGTVTEVNLLRRTVKVKLEDGDLFPQTYHVDRPGHYIGGEYKQPVPEQPAPPPASERPDKTECGGDNGCNGCDRFYKQKNEIRREYVKPQPKPARAAEAVEDDEAEDLGGREGAFGYDGGGQNVQVKIPRRKHRRWKKANDKHKRKPPA